MVLSSLTKVVDAIEWHKGRVPYLLWGYDGTLLGNSLLTMFLFLILIYFVKSISYSFN